MPDILIRGMCAQTSGVSCLLCEQWRGRDNDLINPESAKRCNLWSAAYGREIKTKAYYRCDYSTNIYASERRNTMNDFMISHNKFLDALVLDADGKTDLIQVHQALEKAVISPDEVRGVGEWEDAKQHGLCRCSVCKDCYIEKDYITQAKWNYCPNCGARLEVREDA